MAKLREGRKKTLTTVKKPPIETASWCYRDKEEDVHHDFAWTITSFSRKINKVASGECIESDKEINLTRRWLLPKQPTMNSLIT